MATTTDMSDHSSAGKKWISMTPDEQCTIVTTVTSFYRTYDERRADEPRKAPQQDGSRRGILGHYGSESECS
jgi:hypothetical protein